VRRVAGVVLEALQEWRDVGASAEGEVFASHLAEAGRVTEVGGYSRDRAWDVDLGGNLILGYAHIGLLFHWFEVFAAWHEGLLRAGLTAYGFEDALTDFRLAVLYSLCIPVFSFTMCGPEPEGRTGRLVDAIAERLYASAIELDAGALLP